MRRQAVVIVAVLIGLLSFTSVASARSMYLSKTSGFGAFTYWTQIDGTPQGSGLFGNVHIGSMDVFGRSNNRGDAFAYIEDYDCPEGVLPDGGGHGFEEEPVDEDGCLFKGVRFGEGYGLQFTIDSKLNSARLVGQLTIYGGGHGSEGPIGTPSLDVVWTGVGGTYRDSFTFSYVDDGVRYTDRSRSTSRQAVMSGIFGPMGFDPELSGGDLRKFSYSSKGMEK